MAIIILIGFIQQPPEFAHKSWDVLEYFAGVARISRLADARGWHALCHDISYDTEAQPGQHKCTDINGSAGFV